jgi:Ca-activated chloride channel family protein
MTFIHPEYFYALLLLVPYVVWYFLRRKTLFGAMRFSDIRALAASKPTLRLRLLHLPFLLRVVSICLLVAVLARPLYTHSWQTRHVEGIDIMLAIDVSTSMLAEDLRPNRLEAAKQVANDFIASRPDDRIGLTLFGGAAFTPIPLTLDHRTLLEYFSEVQCGALENGTAIGMGIANAVTKLKESKAKSKVLILLTDGSNNSGDISPLTAAELARKYAIRIYTIGVGTTGMARSPVSTPLGIQYFNVPVEIDMKTLTGIAHATNGVSYRATNTAELRKIYQQIDQLERTKMDVQTYHQREEAYTPFAVLLLLLLAAEGLLRLTWLRTDLNT